MKEIKDYLHLYLGCQIVKGNELVSFKLGHEELHTVQAFGYWPIIKPILRPLNSITKDEMVQLIRVEHPISTHPILSNVHLTGTTIFFGAKDEKMKHFQILSVGVRAYTPTEFVFLLSKHFDLFGLIESGLAIDATTINKPQVTNP